MKAKAEASGKDASGLTHLQEMIVICEYVDGMKPPFHFFKDGKEAGPVITGYKKQMIAKQVEALFK
mgnify:CR=1 FL=1